MLSIHRTIIATVFSACFAAVATGDAAAQTAEGPKPQTTAELAAEMARLKNEAAVSFRRKLAATAERRGLDISEFPVVTITSQGETVEVRIEVKGPAQFDPSAAVAGQVREQMVAAACSDRRWASYLKRGVIVHEMAVTSDGSSKFEVTIAQADCTRIYRSGKVADAQTLAEWAQAAAAAEGEPFSNIEWPGEPLAKVTAHEGTVELRFVVRNERRDLRARITDPADDLSLRKQICSKYYGQISQGLKFHYVFLAEDNTPFSELTIDRVSCLAFPASNREVLAPKPPAK